MFASSSHCSHVPPTPNDTQSQQYLRDLSNFTASQTRTPPTLLLYISHSRLTLCSSPWGTAHTYHLRPTIRNPNSIYVISPA
ncbi:uncharacterized protein LACBIDRAFT_310447 [Laccaria bicolor S238N-H82]|uniref:Predicted protein n=1 Tax=Laccaria bicolor (strain S238N-H82 / ATCC MYA-4686) TaxID=486041 RepID=B0DUD0_LACBS|nr:uncharacterized protein LACBIDRAFT_310447 [Laccaria bicolor S238N-H82]EDR01720.1 predicted protein [Laccaria bicolor S238N-H82]|eukprot:XP_001887533.1 predicted protein [Laccaria bicolor S238N-H82]